MVNSADQRSWLLQKPTHLDLHRLQSQSICGFSRTRVKNIHLNYYMYNSMQNCTTDVKRKAVLTVCSAVTYPSKMDHSVRKCTSEDSDKPAPIFTWRTMDSQYKNLKGCIWKQKTKNTLEIENGSFGFS